MALICLSTCSPMIVYCIQPLPDLRMLADCSEIRIHLQRGRTSDRWFSMHRSVKCASVMLDHQINLHIHSTTQFYKKLPTILGVDISNDMSWNSHIDRISSKANRTLGFLRRNLHSCPKHIKVISYKTLVRPILDYCSSVWDPRTQKSTKMY